MSNTDSKEQLPKELVERFESVISKIGLIPKTAEQCARICMEEMEKEAVAVLDWAAKNWYNTIYFEDRRVSMWFKDKDMSKFFTTQQLYRIYNQSKNN